MAGLDLSGKNAIVTGAARGLGRRYALKLADYGANVAVSDIDLSSHEEYDDAYDDVENSVPSEVRSNRVDAIGIEADITDPDAVERMVETTAEKFGSIDIVVANAGGSFGEYEDTKASQLSLADMRKTIELNLYGTIYTCVAAAPYLKDKGWGRVITISSQGGRRVHRDGAVAPYGVAKAGIALYTKALAQDLGPHGVTANAIAPGYIGTGWTLGAFDDDDVERVENEEIALRYIADPEEVAEVAVFLASEEAGYVTGTVIPVDGGSTTML